MSLSIELKLDSQTAFFMLAKCFNFISLTDNGSYKSLICHYKILSLAFIVFFLQVLCFLCGFVANLPTSFSLNCYTCHDYPGSSEPCSSPTVKQCDSYYDSCISFSATVEYYGMTIPTTYKDCMISQQCNSTALCGHMTDNLPDSAVLKHCSVDCCHGDLCNAQAGGRHFSLLYFVSTLCSTFHSKSTPPHCTPLHCTPPHFIYIHTTPLHCVPFIFTLPASLAICHLISMLLV